MVVSKAAEGFSPTVSLVAVGGHSQVPMSRRGCGRIKETKPKCHALSASMFSPARIKKVELAAFPRGYYASYYEALGTPGDSWSC